MRTKKFQENASCAASADAGAGRTKSIARLWTAEEDAVLRSHRVQEMGTHVGPVKANWSLIQREIPWRSVDQIRARWRRIEYCYVPNRQRVGVSANGAMCKRCGVPRAGHACPFAHLKVVVQAENRRKGAAPNAKVVVVVEAETIPMLDDFVAWKPSSHKEIGNIGDFPWEVTELW